jgi:hypothetical protein
LSEGKTRSHIAIASAIIIAGVLIAASLFVAVGEARTTTTTEISVTTTTMTESCSAASSLLPSLHFAFDVAVDYSGPWNATLTVYSGTAAVFAQCYVGSGPGYVVLNDWNPNGTALLKVSAHKMDGGSGNLTLSANASSNDTAAPFGSASVSVSLPPTSSPDQARSGPISSFPNSWVDVCNQSVTGNTTTSVDVDLNISSTLDHINLDQIYAQVISSPSFVQQSAGRGWVVAEWTAGEASGTGISGELDQVTGLFILTNDGAPDGYIWTYYDLQNQTATTDFASELTSSCPTTGVSSISNPGDLDLQLSIGASVTGQPNAVQLNITEYNDATSQNNISASNEWPVSGLSLGPCGTLELPFGIAVYQGHYTSQNITSATPLTIFTPNANGTARPYRADCPANPQVFSYDFAPDSDTAVTKLTWAGDTSATTYQISASFSITGYWNSTSSFTAFGKGTYTVLAGDEWGHSSIQYLTIPDYLG